MNKVLVSLLVLLSFNAFAGISCSNATYKFVGSFKTDFAPFTVERTDAAAHVQLDVEKVSAMS